MSEAYNKYIRSDTWRNRRDLYKMSYSKKCYICNRSKGIIELHHITYERMRNELDSDLVWLCQKHHAKVHHHSNKNIELSKRHLIIKQQYDNRKKDKYIFTRSPSKLSVWGNPLIKKKKLKNESINKKHKKKRRKKNKKKKKSGWISVAQAKKNYKKYRKPLTRKDISQ